MRYDPRNLAAHHRLRRFAGVAHAAGEVAGMNKPILCLDFDGVCHSYTSGWQGANVVSDPPVDGLFEFVDTAKEHFDIQIFSTRTGMEGGKDAMWIWLCKHWTDYVFRTRPELKEKYEAFEPSFISFPSEKPPALVTLDDRALTFTGIFPDMETLKNFKPWNKK